MTRAKIQVQDVTGNWITIQTVPMQDQIIARSLESIQKQFKKTVRAINQDGAVVQIR